MKSILMHQRNFIRKNFTGVVGSAPTGITDKSTVAYYTQTPPATYSTMTVPTKPTNWEGSIEIKSKAAGTLTTIANRNFQYTAGAYAVIDIAFNDGDIVIENCNFTGICNNMITINAIGATGSVTIRNCRFWGSSTGTSYQGNAVIVSNATSGNVSLLNNFVDNMSGFVFEGLTNKPGYYMARGNFLRNVAKIKSDGAGTRANGIQFISSNNIRGEITYNYIYNEPGKCTQEDTLNMHGSSGQSSNRFKIMHNMVNGVYVYPLTNTSATTGSSTTTDNDGGSAASTDPAYLDIMYNYYVQHTYGGCNIAGGHDIVVFNNIMVNTGKRPDGQPNGNYSSGLGCFDYLNRGSSGFYNINISGNIVGEINPQGQRADIGVGPSQTNISLAAQKQIDTSAITQALMDNQYHFWRKDCADDGITVGLLTA